MAARKPEDAEIAFVEAQRVALSCVSDCAVFGSWSGSRKEQSLSIWDPGQQRPNILRLRTHDGIGELEVRIVLDYQIEVVGIEQFAARATGYRYLVSDIAGRPLLAYDWHPTGASPITTPHLHVPAAGAVTLAQREGSPLAETRTQLGSLHLPTGHITLATVVEMLIREFRVDAARADWQGVLHEA